MAAPAPVVPPAAPLRLDTRRGNHIENWQERDMTLLDKKDCQRLELRYRTAVEFRSDPTPRFNCHGMTFGSRRTRIFKPGSVEAILVEDEYETVPVDEVLPGDVIIYRGESGEIEHSGVVVTKPSEGTWGFPRICSKWGNYREVIHFANMCDFDLRNITYHRIRR